MIKKINIFNIYLENIVIHLSSAAFAVKSHGDIEEFIQQEGTELLRTLLQSYLSMRAENEKHYATVYCNGDMLNHVRKNTSRKMVSLFGTVNVNRLGYSQRKKDSRFPLDKELNLPGNQYSDGLRRRFVHEAIKSSFDESVKSIDRLTGGHVPKRQGISLVHDISQDF